MKLLPSFVALSLLAALASTASAQPVPPGGRGDPVDRMLNRFDANRDGVLDRQELHQLRSAGKARHDQRANRNLQRRQQRFARAVARFDVNRDGRLGPQEVPPRMAQHLSRFDRNHDGWVDASEVSQPPLPAPYAAPPPYAPAPAAPYPAPQ
jgi:EF hand